MSNKRTKTFVVMSILFCQMMAMKQNIMAMAVEQNNSHQGICFGGGVGYRYMIHEYDIPAGKIQGDKKSDDIIGKVILGYGNDIHDVLDINLSVEFFVDFSVSKRGSLHNAGDYAASYINDGVQPGAVIKIGTNVTPNFFMHIGVGCGYAKQLIDLPDEIEKGTESEVPDVNMYSVTHVCNSINPIVMIGGDTKLLHGWKARLDISYRFPSNKKKIAATGIKTNFGPSMGITLCRYIRCGG